METNSNPLTSKSTVRDAADSKDAGTFTGFSKPAMPKSIPKRGKVPLEKGYSQVDWMRTKKEHRKMAGLDSQPLRKEIPLSEVAQHKTAEDAWTVLNGKVYNMTPYLPFHPGGKAQMMRGAGIDSSELFRKYHAWVNADMLLENCLLGTPSCNFHTAPCEMQHENDFFRPQAAQTSVRSQL
ncbi:hypothetical protein WJX84_008147 [Apatococcus fuscideae]|uniref:Cytochrome b5 heme-binding domain-containing protein n=1 Tax=Apatococcus fuscideae TaxID=2026836 RepID=A0AAW1TF03_9CHLO